MSGIMAAKLVFDGGSEVSIPKSMGVPRPDQMQGTVAEQLSELAGRICYDSLGKGRPSFSYMQPTIVNRAIDLPPTNMPVEGYHEHIQKVGHGSVLEHFNFTVQVQCSPNATQTLCVLMNRPGLYIAPDTKFGHYRITMNLRTLVDWDRIIPVVDWYKSASTAIRDEFRNIGSILAPHIIPRPKGLPTYFESIELVEPVYHHEAWITLYMAGSRGFSHEQVRHGDFTAISQRSTRYVDESQAEWVTHPLLDLWYSKEESDAACFCRDVSEKLELQARGVYQNVVDGVEPWLKERGVDSTTARKQARGAARGYLGNALQTEMLFSASVAQWKWMIEQRLNPAADAEIRQVYVDVLGAMKASRYAKAFYGWGLKPSPDGIGSVLDKQPEAV